MSAFTTEQTDRWKYGKMMNSGGATTGCYPKANIKGGKRSSATNDSSQNGAKSTVRPSRKPRTNSVSGICGLVYMVAII